MPMLKIQINMNILLYIFAGIGLLTILFVVYAAIFGKTDSEEYAEYLKKQKLLWMESTLRVKK